VLTVRPESSPSSVGGEARQRLDHAVGAHTSLTQSASIDKPVVAQRIDRRNRDELAREARPIRRGEPREQRIANGGARPARGAA